MYKPCNYAYLLETRKSCMETRLGCLNRERGAPHGCALFDISGSFGKEMWSLRRISGFVVCVRPQNVRSRRERQGSRCGH